MSKKVTMQLIADYLGVSKYVVSRALSGKDGVSAQMREQVLRVASDLGYVNQRKQRTSQITLENSFSVSGKQTVLVLLQNIREQTPTSSYWGRVMKGVSEGLEKHGFGMVVVTEENPNHLKAIINPKGYVGIITIGMVATPLMLQVSQMEIPVIMIDHEDYLLSCDAVFNNNVDASEKMTNYLIGLGHQRIHFVGNIHYSRSFYDRWIGFRKALEILDQNFRFDSSLTNLSEGTLMLCQWIEERQGQLHFPTAFVCANDQIARNLVGILEKKGVKVPDDVSVTGFDNKEVSYRYSPTLTTVKIAKKDLGKRGVEMLIRRLREKDAPYEKVLLEGEVILRESTRPLVK